jgi:hypothetical protein
MFAVYRLSLRDPAHPPANVINRLQDELPGVQIGADGKALVFMSERPDLGGEVRSAVQRICGETWSEHFNSLDNAPEAT